MTDRDERQSRLHFLHRPFGGLSLWNEWYYGETRAFVKPTHYVHILDCLTCGTFYQVVLNGKMTTVLPSLDDDKQFDKCSRHERNVCRDGTP